jgi:predicted dienelactone hydrolase
MMLRRLITALLFPTCMVAQPTHSATRPSNIGFEKVAMPYGTDTLITVGIWYPTDAPTKRESLGGWTQLVATDAPATTGPHPLVVISHGNGGWFAGHYDTALALAHAGFVVAALTHPGDNYQDQSRATDMPLRVSAMHRLIDYMIGEWKQHVTVDAKRVGIFGFSAGGAASRRRPTTPCQRVERCVAGYRRRGDLTNPLGSPGLLSPVAPPPFS